MNMNIAKDITHVRTAAQDLHRALSDVAAKGADAMKADLETVGQKAKAATESVKATIGAENEATKKHLKDALEDFEALQKHTAEALKNSGEAFQASIRQTLADARAAAQSVSEAVATKRSVGSTKSRK